VQEGLPAKERGIVTSTRNKAVSAWQKKASLADNSTHSYAKMTTTRARKRITRMNSVRHI